MSGVIVFEWTSPLKLVLGGIEPETLRGEHFKVPSQYHQTNPSGLLYSFRYQNFPLVPVKEKRLFSLIKQIKTHNSWECCQGLIVSVISHHILCINNYACFIVLVVLLSLVSVFVIQLKILISIYSPFIAFQIALLAVDMGFFVHRLYLNGVGYGS